MRAFLATANRRLGEVHRRSPAFRRFWRFGWLLLAFALFYQISALMGLVPA